MTTETITIVINETGSKVVKRNLEDIGGAADKSATSVESLKGILAGLGGALAVGELIKAADAFTSMESKIRLLTNTTEEATAVYAALFNVAQDTRTPLQDVVNSYQRFAFAMRDLGSTQKDVINFITSLNQAIAISGVTTKEATNGIIQLGQGMASGKLQGQDLRAVLEDIPYVGQVIAKGMGITIGQLRAAAHQGTITAKEIVTAFRRMAPELASDFGKITPTIERSFVVLNNAFENFIGQGNKVAGVSKLVSDSILWMAQNFDIVAAAGLALIAVLGTAGLIVALEAIGGAIASLVGVFAPLVTAFIGVVGLVLEFVAALVTLNPVALAIAATVAVLAGLFLYFQDEIEQMIPTWDQLKNAANKTIGFIVGGVKTIIDVWKLLPAAFAEIAINAANYLYSHMEDGVYKVVKLLNKIPGVDIGFEFSQPFVNKFQGTIAKIGDIAGKDFADAMATNFIKEGSDKIAEGMKFLKGLTTPTGNIDLLNNKVRGGSNAGNASHLSKEQQSQLDALLKKLDPVGAAQQQVTKDVNLLNLALSAGAITATQYAFALGRIKEVLRDQLDPLGAINRAIADETKLLGFDDEERVVQQKLMEAEKALRKSMGELGPQEKKQLEENFTALQKLNDERSRQNTLLNGIVGPQKDFTRNSAALLKLQADGKITTEQYTNAQRELRITFLDTQKDFGSGVERSFLKLQASVTDIAGTVEHVLTSAFDKAGDAIADWALTGKISVDSFFSDLARQLIKMGTNSAFAALGQTLFGAAGGSGAGGGSALGGLGGLISGGISKLFGFASGGSFQVGNGPATPSIGQGIDNRLVAFRARDGERVTITPPGQRPGNNNTVAMYITTPDAGSFKRSQGQITAGMAAALNRANKRNN